MLQISEIEAITAIASEGSISKAALLLNSSQPTLSKLILRLEDRLGAKVFDRSHRGVVPTTVGHFLIDSSKGVVTQLAAIDRHARLLADGGVGEIRLGVGPIVEELFLVPVLANFVREFGNVSLVVRTEPASRLIELLNTGEVDLVVGPFDVPHASDQMVVPVTEQPIIYAVRPQHHLAGTQTPLTPKEILGLALAMPQTPPDLLRQFQSWGDGIGDVQTLARLQCEHYGVLRAIAKEVDFVVSGAAKLFEKDLAEGTLIEIPTTASMTWKCSCVLQRQTIHTKVMRALTEMFVVEGSNC